MNAHAAPATNPARARRRYDNTLRQARAATTRERIVMAGSELLHGSDVRDWAGVTIRAVAQRAGVHERTVYRHFDNERGLRDAVMQRLEAEAGIDLERVELGEIGAIAARILSHVASYPTAPGPALDPTLTEARGRVHAALLESVETAAPTWSDEDRTMAAAVLDVLWSVGAYERLVGDWQLDFGRAVTALRWAIGLVEEAVRSNMGPPGPA